MAKKNDIIELKEQLSAKKLQKLYVFYGEEEYLKEHYIKKIEESKSVFEQLEKELAIKNAEIASITNNGAQDIITRAKVKNEISAVNNKIAQLKDEIETLTRDISVSSE